MQSTLPELFQTVLFHAALSSFRWSRRVAGNISAPDFLPSHVFQVVSRELQCFSVLEQWQRQGHDGVDTVKEGVTCFFPSVVPCTVWDVLLGHIPPFLLGSFCFDHFPLAGRYKRKASHSNYSVFVQIVGLMKRSFGMEFVFFIYPSEMKPVPREEFKKKDDLCLVLFHSPVICHASTTASNQYPRVTFSKQCLHPGANSSAYWFFREGNCFLSLKLQG